MKNLQKKSIYLTKLGLAISLLVLVTTIFFSWKTIAYTQKQIELLEASQKSNLVGTITINNSQEAIVFQCNSLDKSEVLYRQQYVLVLNNIGQINSSIVDFDVTLLLKQEKTEKIMFEKFEGMNPVVTDLNGNKLTLPILIEPNNPRKVLLEVGVKIPRSSWEILPDSVICNQRYNYADIEELFLKVGHPFMGQLDSVSNTSYGDIGNLQKYRLTITKGDGKRVTVEFFHNVSKYLQGETD